MSETLGSLRPGRPSGHSTALLAAAVIAMAGLLSTSNVAEAAKVHSFTFNGTLADTGTSPLGDAVIVNGPAGTQAGLVGGAVNLTVNNNTAGNSNQGDFTAPGARGSYVDLPDGILTGAVQSGTAGQVSLEIWVTTTTNRTWAEIWSFGTSNGGPNSSISGSTSDYIALIPQSGPTDFRAVSHQAFTNDPGVDPFERQAVWSTDTAAPPADTTPVLPIGTRHHIVVTMDQNDKNGGAVGFEKGTMKLYLNGDLNGGDATPTIAGLAIADLASITDHNNWLGRSPWPDSLYQGTIDEFNIYDTALTASQVTSSFNTGPAIQAIPTLTVNRTTGAVTINNPVAAPFNIKQYAIASSSGSLNTAGWTSIDATNLDPNGTWTTQSLTDTNIAESNTGGALDGAPLAGNSANSIGSAWIKSRFEDVTFNFTLSDGTTGAGVVNYTGASSYARSDLNADGAITAADWAIFYPNGFTNLSALSATAAALKGDLDGNKTNDYQDFLLFKADFIAANGAPAFAALTAVPEPATVVVALGAVCGLVWRRRQ